MTYSRTCGIDRADCTALVCTCANEPHTPTQAEREAFWEDEPVRTTQERSEAGREPHSKVWREVFENLVDGRTESWWSEWLWKCPCGDGGPFDTWADAMDAAHAHVREHHALTSANHTPTWEPCGRGICAANAGHEGTCEEASGFYDWTPEFYDDDLEEEPAMQIWADAHRANGARA